MRNSAFPRALPTMRSEKLTESLHSSTIPIATKAENLKLSTSFKISSPPMKSCAIQSTGLGTIMSEGSMQASMPLPMVLDDGLLHNLRSSRPDLKHTKTLRARSIKSRKQSALPHLSIIALIHPEPIVSKTSNLHQLHRNLRAGIRMTPASVKISSQLGKK